MWSRTGLIAYWLTLFTSTHYPTVYVPVKVSNTDKVVHFAAFGVLALLFWKWLATRARPLTPRSVWIAAAVLIPYATIDEFTQQFFGRDANIADWLANLAGITCVLVALELRRRRAAGA
jgi:VanZ family protein